MVLFNYSTKELTAKIVYYGPGLCGKTTNLQYIHANLPGTVKGKMLSLATKTDRTLFFDFLPLDLGTIRGMKTRVQLYTVPGQVFYNETRKLVLKGADGIVFVADSQETMLGANAEAFKNLEENLKAHGLRLAEMPHIIQFNKRDLPRLADIEEMNTSINKYNAPFYESVATTGIGVQDTLKAITKLVLLHLTRKYDPSGKPIEASPKPASATPSMEMPPSPPAGKGVPISVPDSPPVPAAAGTETISTAVPLSMPAPGSESPAPAGFGAPPEEEPVPDFGDSDIDDLVGEVEEHEIGSDSFNAAQDSLEPLHGIEPVTESEHEMNPDPAPEPVREPSFEAETPFSFESDAPQESFDLPSVPGDSSIVGASDSAPVSDWMPIPEEEPEEQIAVPLAGSASKFEVDRGFDPDYSGAETTRPEADQQDPVIAIPPEVEPILSEPEPAPLPSAEPPMEKAPLQLTEVADDDDLFQDPNLEIVRLDAGGTTEVVIPVEIGEGEKRQRFKLSLNLRLDRTD